MINKILVGTDGSDHAGRALKYAGELAAQCGAEVIVAAVDRPGPIPKALREYALSEDISHGEIYEAVGQSGAEAVKKDGATVVDIQILTGDAAVAIVEAAVKEDVDAIILGSRGHGAVAEILLGSVSRKVLHMAKKPTLVVP